MIEMRRKTKEAACRGIGRRLTQKVEEEGLTQEIIAAELSLSQAWVSRILSGQFTERSTAARALCARFRIPFLGERGSHARMPPSERRIDRLQSAIGKISDGQVADLIAALRAVRTRRSRR